jgi:hypothetical protein
MSGIEDVWIPLVDEPIGSIVSQVEDDEPDIRALVDSPRRLLAFKTFAYIRVGLLLGQLLVDQDLEPYDGSETWIEQLMRDPAHRARVAAEVRQVAEEISADPRYAGEESLGPDEDARVRFREFARKQLDS